MILVTGASGMIGRALVERFLREGFDVRAHGRTQESLEALYGSSLAGAAAQTKTGTCLDLALCDIASMTAEQANELCKGCKIVVHSAGLVHKPQSDPSLYETHNVRATQLLSEAAITNEVEKFIFLSSTSVYGNKPSNMISEDAELVDDTPYAASKIACEEHLRLHPPADATFILRPSLVFGPGDRGNMLSLIRQIVSGKYFVIGEGSAMKSMIYSEDLSAAILSCCKSTLKGIHSFNIANPEPVSVKQLSQAILTAFGKEPRLLTLPEWLVSPAAMVSNLVLGKRSPLNADRLAKLTRSNTISVEHFVEKFDFTPSFSLETALAKEISWARQQGLLN